MPARRCAALLTLAYVGDCALIIPEAQVAPLGGAPPTEAADTEPAPAGPRLPSLAAVEEAYRAVLPAKSRSQFQAFIDTYGAVGVALAPGGQTLRLDSAGTSPYLHAVEIDGGYFALFPGGDIIVSFATTYSSQLSMPPEISLAFDFAVDGTRSLALMQAAIWRSDGADGLGPARRGRLAGLAS